LYKYEKYSKNNVENVANRLALEIPILKFRILQNNNEKV